MSWIDKIFKRDVPSLVEKAMNTSIGSPQYYEAVLKSVNKYVDNITGSNKEFIRNGYMFNPTVYSVVRYITRKAAKVPFILYEVKSDRDFKRYKSLETSFAKKEMIRTKALDEIAEHPILDLIDRPNPMQGKQEFFEALIGYKLLTGNSYLHTVDLSSNKVAEMYVLPAHRVTIKTGTMENPIENYIVKNETGKSVLFDPETVCHFRYWNPDADVYQNSLYGLSPIMAGRKAIQMNNDGTQAMAKMFQNMGIMGMFVYNGNDNISLNREQAKQLESNFYQAYGGPNNAGKVKFASNNWKWENVGMSPVDMAILEANKASKRDVCALFNVPSILFNDNEQSTYNNMLEAKKDGFINAVMPELCDIRDEFNRFLIPKFGMDGKKYYLDLDWMAVDELAEDMEQLSKVASNSWWLTLNEKRSLMQYDEDTENDFANDYFIPSNVIRESDDEAPEEVEPTLAPEE